MPTAKFIADFSDFNTGAATTDTKLASFGASVDKAGAKVSHLALVTEQGVSPFNTLRGSVNQFDGALSAMGVNIGPEVKGLVELGEASGKSTKDLGLLATAGFAVAAFTGGFKLGRMVAEFFGLDQAIGNATAKLLGFGDVAAQTAGSVQDTINKALKDGAPAGIQYAEAIQFNIRHLKEFQEGNKGGWALSIYEQQLKKTGTEVSTLTGKQKGLIAEGVALNISHADIAKGLSLTVDAVDSYIAALAKDAAATKEANVEKQKLVDIQDKLFGRDITARAAEYLVALGSVASVTKLSADAQATVNTVMYEAIQTHARLKEVAPPGMYELWEATRAGIPIVAGLGDMFRGFATVAVGSLQTVKQSAAEAAYDTFMSWEATDARIKAAFQSGPPVAAAAAQSIQQSYVGAFTVIAETAEQKFKRMADTAAYYSDLAQIGLIQMGGTGLSRPTGHLQSFAQGGSGDFGSGTPVMLHGKETIVPWGQGGGGAMIHVGGIQIHVGPGGDGARAGRSAADALLDRLESRGIRVS